MDGRDWHEVHLTGDRSSYTLHDLQCGTSYSFFLIAFNSAGQGNASEIISAKTDGTGKLICILYLKKNSFLNVYLEYSFYK